MIGNSRVFSCSLNYGRNILELYRGNGKENGGCYSGLSGLGSFIRVIWVVL